ncbi:50S ribosomal protein L3 [Blattabacterium cuenoti]|uniref:50S ribosomal protein L3 n=1 Tax=Blattabacterium cuenoti TaxID=1653831 RepID=UPI00163B815B|nr:50S ribosomal protein L3 [Blattabacterium cuenoti]
MLQLKGLIGLNLGMTSIFSEKGYNIPCTLIKFESCYITQIKTIEKDGYEAIQLGVLNKKIKHTNKPLLGHFHKSGISPKKKLIEIRNFTVLNKTTINNSTIDIKVGLCININQLFSVGELVNIQSFSKGKGFQGVVKKHGFSGVGEKSHGQHNRLRAPGSIGAGSDPSRVFKGKKMAGRMGNRKITIKNLKILQINIDKQILIIKGSVPGNKYSYLIIKKQK